MRTTQGVAEINRNRWPTSIVLGGRLQSESVADLVRNTQLGTKGTNQTEKELRLVGYRVDGKDYWVATNRYDLTAEEVAEVYKLRWNIETFFGWWKVSMFQRSL